MFWAMAGAMSREPLRVFFSTVEKAKAARAANENFEDEDSPIE